MAVVETESAFLEGCAFYKQGKFEDALKNASYLSEIVYMK